jgi:hypothetical protein
MSKDRSKELGFVKIPGKIRQLNKEYENLKFVLSELGERLKEEYKNIKIKCIGGVGKIGCLKYFYVKDLKTIEFLRYSGEAYNEHWYPVNRGFRCPECGLVTMLENIDNINKDLKILNFYSLFNGNEIEYLR